MPFDVLDSGLIIPRRRFASRPGKSRPTGVPWWVYFWSGAALVWIAIALIAEVGFTGLTDISAIVFVIAGPVLIAYSYRVLLASAPSATPA